MNWSVITKTFPHEGARVETCIKDLDGIRNEQVLIRKGNLWYTDDMKMCVHYTPTHWRLTRC